MKTLTIPPCHTHPPTCKSTVYTSSPNSLVHILVTTSPTRSLQRSTLAPLLLSTRSLVVACCTARIACLNSPSPRRTTVGRGGARGADAPGPGATCLLDIEVRLGDTVGGECGKVNDLANGVLERLRVVDHEIHWVEGPRDEFVEVTHAPIRIGSGDRVAAREAPLLPKGTCARLLL